MLDARPGALLAALAVAMGVPGCGGPAVPEHTGSTYQSLRPVKDGRRIVLDANSPSITRLECERLVAHYRKAAAPEGQVVVRKPSQLLQGQMTPWCVENFDGRGVVFNDQLFG